MAASMLLDLSLSLHIIFMQISGYSIQAISEFDITAE
jgi:hypothetical protein